MLTEPLPCTTVQTDDDEFLRVIVIVGPTAVGKTDLAEQLALRVGGEIVSADSMQVYRRMDIGTAKPAVSERRVPYHCIDLVEPGEPFSAALYQQCARHAIDAISALGREPVVAGGTGLYVRAAIDRLEFPDGQQVNNAVREPYELLAAELGADAVYALLEQVDPVSAALIHPNNTRRVIRALEMHELGVSYAAQAANFAVRESPYRPCMIGLTMARDALYARIDRRVDAMVEAGLVDEVRELLDAGFREALTASQAIGYKELVPVLEEGADLESALDSVKRATRRYAKRQLTWFRADPRIWWLDVTELSPEEALQHALAALDWGSR